MMKHPIVKNRKQWQKLIGSQRDWVWRGWQIRYSYLRQSCQDNNQQPPLIFIHGFGAAIEHWRFNLAAFKQHHSIYALDLLGFGGSRKVSTNYNINLWGQQVYDFWQTFINQPVIIVGHSIGALVCLELAKNHPEMVKGIVMITLPDVSVRQEMIPKFIQPLVRNLENLFTLPILIKPLLKIIRNPKLLQSFLKMAYTNTSVVDDELTQIFAAPAYDEDADQAFYCLSKATNKPGFSPTAQAVLPNLDLPMLLIWGKQDRLVPPSLASRFAPLNSKIKLVEINQLGHCPHDEDPEQFNRLVSDWLATEFKISNL